MLGLIILYFLNLFEFSHSSFLSGHFLSNSIHPLRKYTHLNRKMNDIPQTNTSELTLTSNHSDTAHLYGNSSILAYYYVLNDSFQVDIYVGTPSVQQTLIVDTGSSFMGFSCEPCEKCGKNHINKFFNPLNSSTTKKIGCYSLASNVTCNCVNEACNFYHVKKLI